MKNWLFQHNWKSIKRSPDFHRKVVVNIIFGFFAFIIMLEFLMLGFFLDRLIKEDLMPGSDPLTVVNSFLLYYFGMDLILRLIFQTLCSSVGKQYLLLRLDRKQIVKYILFKTPGTFINIFPLFILIPFFFNGVLSSHNFIPSLAWFVGFLSILLFNTYLVNYSKMRFYKNPMITSAVVGVLVAIVLLEKLKVLSFSLASKIVFSSVLICPVFVLIPIAALGIIYRLNFNFLINHLYVEDFSAVKKSKSFKENFKFLTGFGDVGTFISLDLKLMLRNKRARISLWMPFLFVFYGLFFYPSGHYGAEKGFPDFLLMFVGTFITGFFILSYGMMTFCYESRHFGLILTNKIDMFTYLKSRYYFMLMMSIPAYLLSIFYIYYGSRIFVVNSIMFLFNIGFTAFFFLFLATFNKLKFDLSAGYMSLQGKGTNQFFAVFVLAVVVLIIFIPFRLIFNRDVAIIAMGLIGILGFIFHNQILKLLLKQFYRRRYIMSEGFRQT
jgi:hypothetical protein